MTHQSDSQPKPTIKQPSVAELQERIDRRLQETLEKVLNRPFTMETVDDLRLKMQEVRLGLIDMDRQRNYIDERAYSGVCYQLNYFRMCTEYLTKVCKENGLDFTLPQLQKLMQPVVVPSDYSDMLRQIQLVDTTALIHNDASSVEPSAPGDAPSPLTEEPIGLK